MKRTLLSLTVFVIIFVSTLPVSAFDKKPLKIQPTEIKVGGIEVKRSYNENGDTKDTTEITFVVDFSFIYKSKKVVDGVRIFLYDLKGEKTPTESKKVRKSLKVYEEFLKLWANEITFYGTEFTASDRVFEDYLIRVVKIEKTKEVYSCFYDSTVPSQYKK